MTTKNTQDTPNRQDPTQLINSWIERIVIGVNLCPFAAPSIARGGLEVRVSEARDLESAYRDLLSCVNDLLEPNAHHLESALIVFPSALSEFDELLDCLAVCEDALAQLELEGVFQLASFHPHYRFEGEPEDDPAHWSNRAPYPALHILRESSVSEALSAVSHPEKIPQRNIDYLRSRSPEELSALFSGLTRSGE